MRAIVGLNSGLVQFMGTNKCGAGGAKTLYVTVGSSSSTSGGISPRGGGDIPVSGITESERQLRIYPDSANTEINIELADNKVSRIAIINSQGQILSTCETNQVAITVDVSELASGVYFVKVEGEKNALKRILVDH